MLRPASDSTSPPPSYGDIQSSVYHIPLDNDRPLPVVNQPSAPDYPLYPLPNNHDDSAPALPPPSYASLYSDEATRVTTSDVDSFPVVSISTAYILPVSGDTSTDPSPPDPPMTLPSVLRRSNSVPLPPSDGRRNSVSSLRAPATPPPDEPSSSDSDSAPVTVAVHRRTRVSDQLQRTTTWNARLTLLFCPILGLHSLCTVLPRFNDAVKRGDATAAKHFAKGARNLCRFSFAFALALGIALIVLFRLDILPLRRIECQPGQYLHVTCMEQM